jgi:hypothetical protein
MTSLGVGIFLMYCIAVYLTESGSGSSMNSSVSLIIIDKVVAFDSIMNVLLLEDAIISFAKLKNLL